MATRLLKLESLAPLYPLLLNRALAFPLAMQRAWRRSLRAITCFQAQLYLSVYLARGVAGERKRSH